MNKYNYCLNNPLKFVDPNGCWESVNLLRDERHSGAPSKRVPLSTVEKIIALIGLILTCIAGALIPEPVTTAISGIIGSIATACLVGIVWGLAVALDIITIFNIYCIRERKRRCFRNGYRCIHGGGRI